jgi:anti-anti-sigma regulatory factor
MDINSRPVVVKRMPERVNGRTAREFLRDVQPFLLADRPQLVFDLSQVMQLDAAGVEMLLRCMSEAYETSTDAARSFSGFLPNAMRQQLLHNKRPAVPLAA